MATSFTLTQLKKQPDGFKTALTRLVAVQTNFGEFVCVSVEHLKSIHPRSMFKTETVSKTDFVRDSTCAKRAYHVPLIINDRVTPKWVFMRYDEYKKIKAAADAVADTDADTTAVESVPELTFNKSSKKKIVKVVPRLSKRVGAARAWDDHTFLEADGLWTDVREEIVKLEDEIKSLKERLGI